MRWSLTLRDAVTPEHKGRARDEVVQAVRRLEPARTVVRVNGTGTPWHDDDIAALAELPTTVIMLPMASDVAAMEALAPHPVIALCETAAGVLAAPVLAVASNCAGLMWGSEDLIADLGGRAGQPVGNLPARRGGGPDPDSVRRPGSGVMPIDTVLIDIADLDLLRADSIAAVSAGFAAKACIHPSQVAIVREAFRPTLAQIRWAREVTAAAATASAVFRFAGQMIDAPVLAHAAEILRQAEALPGMAASATEP